MPVIYPADKILCVSHARQNGTTGNDNVNDVAIGTDGSVFLAGETTGDWGSVNEGRSDFALVKLDAGGNEIWRWQVRLNT